MSEKLRRSTWLIDMPSWLFLRIKYNKKSQCDLQVYRFYVEEYLLESNERWHIPSVILLILSLSSWMNEKKKEEFYLFILPFNFINFFFLKYDDIMRRSNFILSDKIHQIPKLSTSRNN
jgi:hypothetical protein